MQTAEAVWDRARRGQHSVVLGLPLSEPPQDLRVMRVSCDIPATTLGPLLEAKERVERVLGMDAPLVEMARARVLTGLRRHLLGDLPSVSSEGSLVEIFNRFATLGPAALVLESAESADPASLDMLRHILSRPGWLRLPLVLVMGTGSLPPAASALVEAVSGAFGASSILSSAPPSDSPAKSVEADQPKGGATPIDVRALPADVLRVLRVLAIAGSGCESALLAAVLDIGEIAVLDAIQRAADAGIPIEDRGEGRFYLPQDVLDTLRASVLPSLAAALHRRVAAFVAEERQAPPSEPSPIVPPSDEVARPANAWDVMMQEPPKSSQEPAAEPSTAGEATPPEAQPKAEESAPEAAPMDVHTALEQARNAAVREAEQAAIRAAQEAQARAFQRAEKEAEERAREEDAAARAAEKAAEEAAEYAVERAQQEHQARAKREAELRRASEKEAAAAVEDVQRELSDEGPKLAYQKPFTGEAHVHEGKPRARWLWPPHGSGEPTKSARLALEQDARARRMDDDARAARHLAAAGDAEAAIERYFQAMQRAAASAAYPQAVAHAQAALALIDALPSTAQRKQLRAEILLETGRVLWHGAGPDETFTLQGALRVLDAAHRALDTDAPFDLHASIAATVAGVLHEIGDVESLNRALEELSNASRALAQSGHPETAARLFNDQAGVYIRLGDPVRAAHLLTQSRKIFEPSSKTDPVAMVEMAETDHLFARILLLARARPGRESDALSLALDHAIAAERAFRRLGAPREVGRVLETMGRIELRKGRLDRATDRLTSAVQIQEPMGDVMGLAQSTAALADVLAAGGHLREALSLLLDSITLHHEKGSPLGIALNRRAFDILRRHDPVANDTLGLLDAVGEKLAQAESALGRVAIPGSPDEPPPAI